MSPDVSGEEPQKDDEDTSPTIMPLSALRKLLVILSLGIPVFLQASNMSALTTIQSAVITDLQCDDYAAWLNLAYLIPMSSFSPIAGRLSQIFGSKACVAFASGLIALGSLVTGTAPTYVIFLLGRCITGLGAAGVAPVVVILVIEITSERRRGLLIGLVNAGFTIGVSLGSVLAGALLRAIGWRFVFTLQAPLAGSAALCICFIIPSSAKVLIVPRTSTITSKLRMIDYLGAVTLTSSLVLLCLGITTSGRRWSFLVPSIVLLLLFVLIERYFARFPIIPVKMLRSRTLLCACFAQLILMAARWQVLFYTPVYALAVRCWSPTAAGAILIPANAGFAVGSLSVGLLHVRHGRSYWAPCLLSILGSAASILLIGILSTDDSSAIALFAAMSSNGFSVGAALNYTLAHLVYVEPSDTRAIALALLGTFRGFATSLGTVAGGAVFSRVFLSESTNLLEQDGLVDKQQLVHKVLASPALVAGLVGLERRSIIAGFVRACMALFTVTSVLALVAVIVQSCTGWSPSKGSVSLSQDRYTDDPQTSDEDD